jgi:hypothetical protein
MDELTLSCGHSLSEIVTDPEGTSYCRACASERTIDSEAIEETEDAAAEALLTKSRAGTDTQEEQRQDSELDGAPDSLPQPAFGVRGSEPGPRGCWGVNNRGEPCGAFVTRNSDYCSAHRGLGVGKDPKAYSRLATDARRRQLAARAELRMIVGDRGRIGPRMVLREHVAREAEPLVRRAVGAALSPMVAEDKAAKLALDLIREADPPTQATVEISGDLAREQVNELSLSQLLAVAEANGIPIPELEQHAGEGASDSRESETE